MVDAKSAHAPSASPWFAVAGRKNAKGEEGAVRRIPVWAFLAGRRKGKLAVTAIAVLGWTVGALSPGVSAQGVEGSGGNVRVFSVSCADRGQGEFGLTVAMLPGGVRELLGAGGSRMLGRGGEDWSKCGMVSFSTSCVPKEDESENREGDGRGDGGGGGGGGGGGNKNKPRWGGGGTGEAGGLVNWNRINAARFGGGRKRRWCMPFLPVRWRRPIGKRELRWWWVME